MIAHVLMLLFVTLAGAAPANAAQPATETVRIGIPGKLADFGPLQRVINELSAAK